MRRPGTGRPSAPSMLTGASNDTAGRAGTEHRHRLLDPEPVEGRDEVGGEHLGASSLPGGDHVQYPHYPSPCRRLALYAELTGPVSTPSPY